ncbi:hypothetical protein BH24DEI2_BH24DEI2_18840 [soil metagenome]
MSVVSTLVGGLLRPVLEQQAKGQSFQALAHALERASTPVTERLDRATDTLHNRKVAHHIIGIERWGQRRLQVPLGEAFVDDSYQGYRLAEDADLATLRSAFGTTRRDTVELVRELEAAKVDPTTKVCHNDLGALSVGAWLAYLTSYGKRESSKLKP